MNITGIHHVAVIASHYARSEFTDKKFTFFADPDGLPLELHEV